MPLMRVCGPGSGPKSLLLREIYMDITDACLWSFWERQW